MRFEEESFYSPQLHPKKRETLNKLFDCIHNIMESCLIALKLKNQLYTVPIFPFKPQKELFKPERRILLLERILYNHFLRN
jgi:hypothetical protein